MSRLKKFFASQVRAWALIASLEKAGRGEKTLLRWSAIRHKAPIVNPFHCANHASDV